MGWMSAIVTPTRRWTLNYYITRWRPEVSLEARPVGDKMRYRKLAHSRVGPQAPDWEFWGSDELEIRCWIGEHVPERLGPQAAGWAAWEKGKETRWWPIEWGSICCSSVRSPTPSHTQPFQIKWEVYFSKNCVARLYCCVVMFMHASAYEYTTE